MILLYTRWVNIKIGVNTYIDAVLMKRRFKMIAKVRVMKMKC